jgi:hypothetical protein
MKLKLAIATAAAVIAVTGAGAAMAQTSFDLTAGTPTLTNGDDGFAYVVTPVSSTEATFSDTFYFDVGPTGTPSSTTASIIPITATSKATKQYNGKPSVTNLTATFYDLTTKTTVGTISESSLTSLSGATLDLKSGNDYSVTLTGKNTTPVYNGTFGFDVATAPVPGPTGFLVAIGGMGALLLKRRRSIRSVAA